jgi:hypothetical protein
MIPSELLAKPENWTKNWRAMRDGKAICIHEAKETDCFCLGGALLFCRCSIDEVRLVDSEIKRISGEVWIPAWNDKPERTHAEVLAVLKVCNL